MGILTTSEHRDGQINATANDADDDPPPGCSGPTERHSEITPPSGQIALIAHTLNISQVFDELKTSQTHGLQKEEAARRLVTFGENIIGGNPGLSIFRLLVSQLANALTVILIAALALSFGVQDYVEGGIIAGVIILNTVIGFIQEYKAEKTMDSLLDLSSPTAVVVRDGQPAVVPSKTLVPGDVVRIKVGDIVPADCRLVSISNLEISEQLLTGESVPVSKSIEPFSQLDLAIGDRLNLVYSSTVVTSGRGTGIVVATGMDTQIGRIADAMNGKNNKEEGNKPPLLERIMNTLLTWSGVRTGTPLQRKLTKLAYVLFAVAILLVVVVFAVARFKINGEVVIYAIALAVGVVPESLVVVLTVTMSIGTRRMASRHVIVRKMDALENLGGVTDICSDKTGTLTLGKMSVRKLWVVGDDAEGYELSNEIGSNALGPGDSDVMRGITTLSPTKVGEGLAQVLRVASLCNVATVQRYSDGTWMSTGDPTEVALQVFATKLGLGRTTLTPAPLVRDDTSSISSVSTGSISRDDTMRDVTKEKHSDGASVATTQPEKRFLLQVEFPFSSATKRMSIIYIDNQSVGTSVCLTKGAIERILDASTTYVPKPDSDPAMTAPLTDDIRKSIQHKAECFAAQGLRVIGLAQRYIVTELVAGLKRENVECDLTFLAFCGIFDPPRPESIMAVRACKAAGITVHMLTGDHFSTAKAIAESVEIITKAAPASAVVTATDFDRLTDAQIDALPDLPLVIARCAPDTKVRMIKAGARRKRHMAMTGDGVNDSPALKLAPIGIAMGSGSDVAKEASDLVLTDDNFDSIRSAVAEGRRLFLNIQRFTLHLLSTNVALVVLLVSGLGFQDRDKTPVFPLSPIAVLWINMITGTPPSLGLGMEAAPVDLMRKPPHSIRDGIFSWSLIVDTFAYGVAIGVTCLSSFVIVMYTGVREGNLGYQCNHSSTNACSLVFKARSTVFATLVFEFMLYAFQLKSFDRSVLRLDPLAPFYKTLWSNQTLFWSVICAMTSVVFPIYIPILNTRVFYQGPIDWEWAVVFAMTMAFLLWCEIWKIVRAPLYKIILPSVDTPSGLSAGSPSEKYSV